MMVIISANLWTLGTKFNNRSHLLSKLGAEFHAEPFSVYSLTEFPHQL